MNTPPSSQVYEEEKEHVLLLSLLEAQHLLCAEQQAEQRALPALRGTSSMSASRSTALLQRVRHIP
jgi:hypothetical protein